MPSFNLKQRHSQANSQSPIVVNTSIADASITGGKNQHNQELAMDEAKHDAKKNGRVP